MLINEMLMNFHSEPGEAAPEASDLPHKGDSPILGVSCLHDLEAALVPRREVREYRLRVASGSPEQADGHLGANDNSGAGSSTASPRRTSAILDDPDGLEHGACPCVFLIDDHSGRCLPGRTIPSRTIRFSSVVGGSPSTMAAPRGPRIRHPVC